MRKIAPILFVFIGLLTTKFSFAQEQEQRIRASYLLAFNKTATDGEVAYWKGQGNLSMSQLMAKHKEYLASNQGLWMGVLQASYADAFGRAIEDGERAFHGKYPRTYTEMMAAHMKYLNENPSLYDDVIRRSYSRALNRQPDNGELNYWRGQQKVSFIWLFRAHNEWAKSQRSNTVSMSGVSAVPVSAGVAAEARMAIASLVGNDGASLVAAGGGNLVAAGGGNLVAAGGGNLVAAGGGN